MRAVIDPHQDDVLAQAVQRADAMVEKGIQELEAKRWKWVAEGVKALKVRVKSELTDLC